MSELTRQLSVAARLSTLDPDVPCVQNECGHSFPSAASESPLLLVSLPPSPQIGLSPFLNGWHRQWGGFGSVAHLPCCLSVEMPAWEAAVMLVLGCGLEQNWNGCFPSGSEQLSDGNKCQYPTAGAWFCCVYVFVSCMCNFWTTPVPGSSFLLFSNECTEQLM